MIEQGGGRPCETSVKLDKNSVGHTSEEKPTTHDEILCLPSGLRVIVQRRSHKLWRATLENTNTSADGRTPAVALLNLMRTVSSLEYYHRAKLLSEAQKYRRIAAMLRSPVYDELTVLPAIMRVVDG